MTTFTDRIRDNKAVYVAAGAGDLAVEKFRELPETVAKLREDARKYQGELKENVTKLQERVDTRDIPGAAASYVVHAGNRVVEFVDALAARGEKVVNKAEAAGTEVKAGTETVAGEVEAGAKETVRKAKTASSKSTQAGPRSAKSTRGAKADDTPTS